MCVCVRVCGKTSYCQLRRPCSCVVRPCSHRPRHRLRHCYASHCATHCVPCAPRCRVALVPVAADRMCWAGDYCWHWPLWSHVAGRQQYRRSRSDVCRRHWHPHRPWSPRLLLHQLLQLLRPSLTCTVRAGRATMWHTHCCIC